MKNMNTRGVWDSEQDADIINKLSSDSVIQVG